MLKILRKTSIQPKTIELIQNVILYLIMLFLGVIIGIAASTYQANKQDEVLVASYNQTIKTKDDLIYELSKAAILVSTESVQKAQTKVTQVIDASKMLKEQKDEALKKIKISKDIEEKRKRDQLKKKSKVLRNLK